MTTDCDLLTKVAVAVDIQVKEPTRYHIIMFNDSVTTEDFVLSVLTEIFGMSTENALGMVTIIESLGSSIVANNLSFELATHLCLLVSEKSRMANFNLRVEIKEENS